MSVEVRTDRPGSDPDDPVLPGGRADDPAGGPVSGSSGGLAAAPADLPADLAGLVELVAASDRAARADLWRCGTAGLEETLADVGVIRQRLEVLERRVVAEALERGLPLESGHSPVDWVTTRLGARAPTPSPYHGAAVVRLARAQTEPRLARVIDRMDTGDLAADRADRIVAFHSEVDSVADPVSLCLLTQALTDGAADSVLTDPDADPEADPEGTGPHGADPGAGDSASGEHGDHGETIAGTGSTHRRVPGVTHRQLAVLLARARRLVRPAKDLDQGDTCLVAGRGLFIRSGPAGMTEYRLLADPEAAAVLDATLAALSAPRPGPAGEPDPRSPARRRGDALVDLVRRGAACTEDTALPGAAKAHVVVTIGLQALLEGLAGAGVTATGQVLAPGTVRRMACDAGILPLVLGTEGSPLDLGRTARLFTPTQRAALAHRDGGCSFPGCTRPPAWCDAHHIIHWLYGGLTNLDNGALLCPSHHTHVHRLGLTATVTSTGVTWHT